MQLITFLRSGHVRAALLTGITLFAASAKADTVWHRSGGAPKALMYENVKVQGVENGSLIFISQTSGNETRKKLSEIARLQLDDEPAFSAAETAYDAGNFKAAIDGYTKAAQSSSRDWIRNRSATRLVDAGNKSNDLSAQVAGFAFLATTDADAALQAKPVVPPDASAAVIDAAVAQVKQAEKTPGLKPSQAKVLLNFRIELLSAKKDTSGASAALQELNKLDGLSAPGTVDNSPASNRARAEAQLNQARVAVGQKNYKQAIGALQSSASFTDPDQQAEALYLVAESKAALAGEDPKALTDAAIAYMRVVANFKTLQGSPHVADSLMKTAAIEERLAKPDAALRLYTQVSDEFKGSPTASKAAEEAARVSASLKPKG